MEPRLPRTALTIGTFDAVHLGHAAILAAARDAVGDGGSVIVLSFDPAPAVVLRQDAEVGRLTTFERRTELLRAAGASEVRRLEPTPALLGMEAEAFARDVLSETKADLLVEGEGFRFGRGRAGTVDSLRRLGSEHGWDVMEVSPVEVALCGHTFVRASSSMVRRLLSLGRVDDAARVLGRPYGLEGQVVRGDRKGRDLGVPTANLDAGDLMLPGDGIYAGHAQLEGGQIFPAAISVGTKPTFDGRDRVCEAHIIGYDGEPDWYDWRLQITVEHWIREQLRFSSGDALAEQMKRDIAEACTLLAAEHGACG